MRWTTMFMVVGLILASSPYAHAGKVEDVKKAVKDKCSTDIPQKDLLSAVIKAFDCDAKADVTVAGCSIKCLKGDSGNVVGGR